jgi:hypothetical protein
MEVMPTPLDEDDPTPRATPGQRPAAPPTKGPAKPIGKPPPTVSVIQVAEPETKRLAWGHVGSVTRPGRLTDGTSRPGVIRVVEAGISYHPPPLEPYVWAQASLNYVGQFELPWSEGDPEAVPSLADFAAEMRQRTPSRQQLAMLDSIADALLANAEKLHQQDHRLGLLELGNVLIVLGSEGRRIVLSDVGFVWRGSHGDFPWKDSPGRPRWLNDDPRENPSACLWDNPPAAQQFTTAESAGEDVELVPPHSDLKTLARLFAAVLTGRVERDLAAPNAAAVWGVLRSVLRGDINSATQFREQLNEHRLSEHWLAPLGPKATSRAVPIFGAIALLVIVSSVILLVVFGDRLRQGSATASNSSLAASGSTTKEKTGPAHPLDKTEVDWRHRPATQPPEIADLIKQLDEAKDPKLVIALLVKLYEVYERSDAATRDRLRPWVDFYRGLYVDSWEMRYREADDAVIKNIGLRFDIGRRVHDLHVELAGLRRQYEPISPSLDEREGQCLLISELRSRELGSP